MKTSGSARASRHSFTLIEMLVAITVLFLLLVLLAAIVNQANAAWSSSRQRLETFQNGRAILELMARELAPAAIAPDLQFVQNPAVAGQTSLNNLLPSGTLQAANSDSLFWQTPSTPNAYGNMDEAGYFLTTVAATTNTAPKYELVRFHLAPNAMATSQTTAANHGANSSSYWIYDPPTAYSPVFAATTPWPEYADAPWLTTLSAAQFQAAISVVSEGVIAFWVRCLDKNGDPVPWLYQSSLYSAAFSATPNLKFNSAAAFNPATLGVAASFTYTAPPSGLSYSTVTKAATTPSGTVAANRLPSAVELTVVTLDSRTLARNPVIPAIPAATGATDVPTEIQNFMDSLVANHIKTARVFTTTVRLVNGTE